MTTSEASPPGSQTEAKSSGNREKQSERVTPLERSRRLQNMKDREKVAAYSSKEEYVRQLGEPDTISRLEARLDILDRLIEMEFVDEMFLERIMLYSGNGFTAVYEHNAVLCSVVFDFEEAPGRQEMNPGRFRRSESLARKWQFVHNAKATQELIDVIHLVKLREIKDE